MVALVAGLAFVSTAFAVPEADHVRIECTALTLSINDFTTRRQLKLKMDKYGLDQQES